MLAWQRILPILDKGVSVLLLCTAVAIGGLVIAHDRLIAARFATIITVPLDLEERLGDLEEYSPVPEGDGTDYFMDALCYPDMGPRPDDAYRWAYELLDATQECVDA